MTPQFVVSICFLGDTYYHIKTDIDYLIRLTNRKNVAFRVFCAKKWTDDLGCDIVISLKSDSSYILISETMTRMKVCPVDFYFNSWAWSPLQGIASLLDSAIERVVEQYA